MFCHVNWLKAAVRTLVLLSFLTAGVCLTMFAQDGQPSSEGRAAAAPPAFIGPLTLKSTFIDTNNGALSLSTTAATAFSPRNITCPASHANGCTLKIETSSQFWDIASGSVGQELITVSGGLTASPSSIVNTDATSTGPLASVRTFQWMVGNVPAGTTHTITISLNVNSGTASAGYRTATIQLYLN